MGRGAVLGGNFRLKNSAISPLKSLFSGIENVNSK